jgi:benzaldehyde dehydrogenase (NAD)
VRRAAGLLERHRAELVRWVVRESGSIPPKADNEISASIGQFDMAASLISHPLGHMLPSLTPGRSSMARRVPVGVVGVICPWNFPVVLPARSVGPALALGNAVILKSDPNTPVSGGVLTARIFEEAGLPEGVLHVLPGGPETGEALIGDPRVRVISFTGSTAAGRRVGELAGARLKKVSLELGGNNAFIVLDDADLDAATAAGAFSSFQFQGQVCFAAGRHIVHERVAGEYVEALRDKAQRLRLGDPYREDVQLGPIVNDNQVHRVDDIVRRSVDGGARLVTGGTFEGLFYQPTVLAEVTQDLPAWTDEIFGPVAPVATFRTDEEAVALANSSEYGLVGAVYSRSISRGLSIANRIKAGMVHVNDGTLNDEATIPFGGTGLSGNGARYGGEANLDNFTEWQWVTVRDEPPTFPF